MSDGSDQPNPSNPFGNPLAPKPVAPNPFGASQLGGAQPPSPASSFNPFAQQPAAPAPAPAAGAANPFAQPAAPAAAPAPAAGAANPFAQPAAPAAAPAPTPTAGAANPFAQPAAPATSPAAPAAASLNPFEQPAQAQPDQAPAQPAQAPAQQAQAAQAHPSAEADEGPSQDQLQQLNPFRMAAQEAPSREEMQALAGDFKLDLMNKKTALSMTIGAAVAALVIGLLIGNVSSERRAHSTRVLVWKQMDRDLKAPMKELETVETLVNELVEGAKKTLLWDKVQAIPTKFSIPDSSLLAPPVPLSQPAMMKLSELVMQMKELFSKAAIYRATTLKDRGAIELILDKKDFSAMPVHAIHVESYLKSCLNRGRTVCSSFDSLKQGAGRVVAISDAKINRGKIKVITRDDNKPFEVELSELVLVPRADIVGSGVNPLIVHNQKLQELKLLVDAASKTRQAFEKILSEKRTLE